MVLHPPKSTVERVRLTAAELAGVNNDSIKLFIDDAWLEVDALPFKEDVKEKACRYSRLPSSCFEQPKY